MIIIVHMLARFKYILLAIVSLFRRAACCFSSRRRRQSFSDCEILTSVNVVQNSNTRHRDEVERDWNSWDDSPRTVGEHIEQYRQKLAQSKEEDSEQPSVDFFQDMIPKVVKQKKLFVDTNANKNAAENFSRLQATTAAHIPRLTTAELEDWSDEENENEPAGWDEVNDEATKQMIREKRREARAERHQRLQQQKQQQNHVKGGLYAHQ